MKILFICTANRDRSLTAHHYFKHKYLDHEFDSAGINKYLSERHPKGKHLKRHHLDWADRVVCMEMCHQEYIVQKIDKKYLSKIEVLHLDDVDTYMTENLVNRLEEKFKI